MKYRDPADITDKQERELASLSRDIATGRVLPPEVRLAQQLRETLGKWDRIFRADLL